MFRSGFDPYRSLESLQDHQAARLIGGAADAQLTIVVGPPAVNPTILQQCASVPITSSDSGRIQAIWKIRLDWILYAEIAVASI